MQISTPLCDVATILRELPVFQILKSQPLDLEMAEFLIKSIDCTKIGLDKCLPDA